MSQGIKEPLLTNEPNGNKPSKHKKKKKKLNAKHINIPNAENLRESKVYVTREVISIYIDCDINNQQTRILSDTIILINDDEKIHENWIEVYLPIPGWITYDTFTTSLIKINDHEATNDNKEFLFDKFREKEANENKCIESIKLYFRKRPRLLNLIVLIILGFCELFVITDLYFDTVVAIELYKSEQPIWFSVSCILIIAPYFVAWSVLFQFIRNKVFLQSFHNKTWKEIFYKFILFPLFLVSPLGLITLILYDCYHTFECFVLKPIWFGITGRKLRTESYGELGYKKLRSVSEIFAETICQSMFYAWILYRTRLEGHSAYDSGGLRVDLNKVLMSFGSSLFSIVLYGTILYIEAKQNGLSLVEFLCVVMTGSFNFVPKLPAIERGKLKKNLESVNWLYYKFTNTDIGNVAMALISPYAYCNRVKISNYTIQKIHRFSGKFFGKLLDTKDVELIYSWRESHIKDWFFIFDIDKSHSFEFEEFARLIVCMNCVNQLYSYYNSIKNEAPQLIYSYNYNIDSVTISEFIEIFNSLASKDTKSNSYCIWMLDVLLKIKSSTEWLPVLDHYKPLYYSIQTNNITMISVLSAYNYFDKAYENKIEFDKSLIESIINKKYKIAMIICENKGIPIVVYLDKIKRLPSYIENNNKNMYLYVTVHIMNCVEYKTRVIPISNDNVFDDYILFVIPFQKIDTFRERKYNSLEFRLSYKCQAEEKEQKEEDKTDRWIFIDKISINLNEYQQIYKKQAGEILSLIRQKQSNHNVMQMAIESDKEYYIEEDEENESDQDLDEEIDESFYNVEIKNEENDFLIYKVYFGALNIYEQYGLTYLDENNIHLLQSVEELDKYGDDINYIIDDDPEAIKQSQQVSLTQQLPSYINTDYGSTKINNNADNNMTFAV